MVNNSFYLIKNVSEMRVTYQIKLLTYLAQLRTKNLIVQLPVQARVHSSLGEFVRSNPGIVKIERA